MIEVSEVGDVGASLKSAVGVEVRKRKVMVMKRSI
jgi:hypothetical protein